MSITGEDLQFMADVMRENSLYSIDDDLDFSQLLPPDEHVEATANESDALLERRSKEKTKTPTAATPQAAGRAATSKARSKEKARDKSSVAAGDGAKTKDNKDKAKMPPPQTTSPLSDVYLSSLPDTLVKPKVDGKLSKSMKGASQNGNQAPQADISFSFDPYGIPTSPVSKPSNEGTPTQKTKSASPVAGVANMTSSLALIPASDKKRLKSQKRVAKRSFLDMPEAPETETEVKPAQANSLQAQPPDAKAPLKAAVKPKRKAPAGKGKGKEKEKKEEKAEPAKPAAKPVAKPKPTKIIAKVDKQDQDSRAFLVPKSEEKDDSPYDIPAAVADVTSKDVTKRLRSRTEKPAIIISSDSESSYSDDDSASFAGNTTIMTTPDHAVEDFSLRKLQRQKTQTTAASIVATKGQMVFGKSNKRPADRAAVGMADRQTKVLRQADASVKYSVADNEVEAPSTSYAVKSHTGGQHLARGPEAFVSEQGSRDQARLQRSPYKYRGDQWSKQQKSGRSLDADHDHNGGEADSDHAMMQSQGSSSKVVHSVAASDPFIGDLDEERRQQSQFTSKLFRSTKPAYDIEQWQRSRPAACQPHFSTTFSAPRAERDAPASRMSHASNVPHGVSEESNHIAREMMQLLTSGRRAEPVSKSAKDIWLDETDPYKETNQVMGYFCKTLLRFLKTKEAAVDDVATEYRQRGGAVLGRIKELHGTEKRRFALEFEGQRQKSLAVLEEACRAARKISGSLERVSLVPAIKDVLGDNTITRLRALQAEVV